MSRSCGSVWKWDWCRAEHLSVDGSFVEANAAKESRIPRRQLAEAAQVKHTVRQYLVELEQQNPVEEPVHQQDQVSTTDPDSTYATKGGTPARLGYYDNYLVDNHSCVIVGVQATAARMSQETVAAQDMLTRFAQWQGREPESVAADATYGNGEFLQWLLDRGITPYMRTRDSALRKNSPFYGPECFTYQPESNSYRCPAGEQLNYVGLNVRNRAHAYIGSAKRCGACSQKPQCTSGRYKYLAIHMHEPARQRARDLANTPAFANAQREQKKVEALFAELKNHDRTASRALTPLEVRAGAVLPGGGCTEHQTTSAVPRPTDNTHWGSRCLTEVIEQIGDPCRRKDIPLTPFFNTHRR